MSNREMPEDGKTPDKGMLERYSRRRALEERAKAKSSEASEESESDASQTETERTRSRTSL